MMDAVANSLMVFPMVEVAIALMMAFGLVLTTKVLLLLAMLLTTAIAITE